MSFKCTECGEYTLSEYTCTHCFERMQCQGRKRVGDYVYRCSEFSYHGDSCTFFDGQDVDYAPVFVSQPRYF
jgi:hypothetical protein